jgi:hypothetical protein
MFIIQMLYKIIKQHYLNNDYFYVVLSSTKHIGTEVEICITKRPRQEIIYKILKKSMSHKKNETTNEFAINIYNNLESLKPQFKITKNLGIDDRILNAINNIEHDKKQSSEHFESISLFEKIGGNFKKRKRKTNKKKSGKHYRNKRYTKRK